MKNVLRINHETREIIMDRAFEKASSIVGSEEYLKLQMAMKDFSTYSVTRRHIKKCATKESYKGLTYEYMENYILTHDNAAAIMEEYKELRVRAKCHSIRYANIKQWFLQTYPQIDDFSAKSEKQKMPQVCQCPRQQNQRMDEAA